jgi:glycosyltransferase involved in cell wall biosynthesis
MRLVVVIPAFNEQDTIGEVISKIPKDACEEVQILVIDDGSTDKTAEMARKNGAEVLSFRCNRGLANAFRKGISQALSKEADVIVNIDADGQHDPRQIKDLVSPILKGEADLVIGSRFKNGKPPMPKMKYLGNVAFTKLLNLLTGEALTDAQSGFRAFTREVAENLDIVGNYTYTQQMIVQASHKRFKIIEIPIEISARAGEDESRLMRSPFHFAIQAGTLLLTIIARYHPLKFFGATGSMFMMGGIAIGLLSPVHDVLSSLIIAAGVQFILFGLLFETFKK